jgi:hypothetical protein
MRNWYNLSKIAKIPVNKDSRSPYSITSALAKPAVSNPNPAVMHTSAKAVITRDAAMAAYPTANSARLPSVQPLAAVAYHNQAAMYLPSKVNRATCIALRINPPAVPARPPAGHPLAAVIPF